MLPSFRQVDGNSIIWIEHTKSQVLNANDLTVQAVVQNGKIQSLVHRPGKFVKALGVAGNRSRARVSGHEPGGGGAPRPRVPVAGQRAFARQVGLEPARPTDARAAPLAT
jgi:hypothetical protein